MNRATWNASDRADWIADPQGFWSTAATHVDWYQNWDAVYDPARGWFAGATTNICHNAIDRHVAAGRGAQTALIWESPVTGNKRLVSYEELLNQVARLAGALGDLGVGRGDRVIIYMPMIPETAMAMLACARIGAVHSVVFGGFASEELAKRIDDARPVLVLCASAGVEPGREIPYKPLLDTALAMCVHRPTACLVLQREGLTRADLSEGRDLDWNEAVARARPVAPLPVESTEPLYILYTSGTTGAPKGIIRDHGGHAVAVLWAMQHVYGAQSGETFWAASDFGWAVGHSFSVYGPLLLGCASVIYEGKPVGTPDAGIFWRIVNEHHVGVLFAAPTAFRAIIQQDPDGRLLAAVGKLPLRALFLAGERADGATLDWLAGNLGVPIVDHWWQTETGWPIASTRMDSAPFEIRRGSVGQPLPGYDVKIVDESGTELPSGSAGSIVIRLPLPPGCSHAIWGDTQEFERTYLSNFAGCYSTGDEGVVDADNFLTVLGRQDDVLNVAGHRLSIGRIEEVVAGHPSIAECAVVGVHDDLKGERPLALVVPRSNSVHSPETLGYELEQLVRERIGGIAALSGVVIVQRLPKTRSGKLLRRTMREIASGSLPAAPATIEDPAVLEELVAAVCTWRAPPRKPDEGRGDEEYDSYRRGQ